MFTNLETLKQSLALLDNKYSENWVKIGPTIYGTDEQIEAAKNATDDKPYRFIYTFSNDNYYLKRVRIYICGKQNQNVKVVIQGQKKVNKEIISIFSKEPQYLLNNTHSVLLDMELLPGFEWIVHTYGEGSAGSTTRPELDKMKPIVAAAMPEIDTVAVQVSGNAISKNSYIIVYGVLGQPLPPEEEDANE